MLILLERVSSEEQRKKQTYFLRKQSSDKVATV